MVGVELEVLAKKYDRFGWDRDRGSITHDRLLTDWMNALQDYPLDEVRNACAQAVILSPNRMPNEGHVLAEIRKARKLRVEALPPVSDPEPVRDRVSAEAAQAIVSAAGFAPRRFGGDA